MSMLVIFKCIHTNYSFSFTKFVCLPWNMKRCIVDNEMRMFHLRGSIFILLFKYNIYTQLHAYMIPISSYAKLTFLWMSYIRLVSSRLVSIAFVIPPVLALPFSGVVFICLFVCSIPSLFKCRREEIKTIVVHLHFPQLLQRIPAHNTQAHCHCQLIFLYNWIRFFHEQIPCCNSFLLLNENNKYRYSILTILRKANNGWLYNLCAVIQFSHSFFLNFVQKSMINRISQTNMEVKIIILNDIN